MVELSLGLNNREPGGGRAGGQLHALCSKASERYPQDTIYDPDIHFSWYLSRPSPHNPNPHPDPHHNLIHHQVSP